MTATIPNRLAILLFPCPLVFFSFPYPLSRPLISLPLPPSLILLQQEPQFQASYTSPLPLTEYFEFIKQHFKVGSSSSSFFSPFSHFNTFHICGVHVYSFIWMSDRDMSICPSPSFSFLSSSCPLPQLRMNIGHCQEWLSRHAQQFRSIQKRLLSRFKDKTPVGLAHLDTLLDGTYMQVCGCVVGRGGSMCGCVVEGGGCVYGSQMQHAGTCYLMIFIAAVDCSW